MGKILVTAALPYANGSIHIGHLVEYIQTDIFVRFLKLIGKDAVYCCASDAHGTPIEIKAHEQKTTPKELVAKYLKEHQEDFKKFHIQFDSFYTTDSEENKHFAESIFLKLKEKNLIYTKEVENFYDEELQRFLPDRYVKGECPKCNAPDQYGDVCERCNNTHKPVDLLNPYSTLSGSKPTRKSSEHYFFKLSERADEIKQWLESNKSLQPEIVNYVQSWIKEGLQDWDISRDGPYFGFKIPGEENKFFYVWLDAPMGYLASFANYLNQGSNPKERAEHAASVWNQEDTQVIHFIGKDIIYFHFLFWPTILNAADYKRPDSLTVHGFLTVNGEKMSKSRGTFFTANEFAQKYSPEYLRYYYASMLSKKMSDIDLDFNDFVTKVNAEIVGNLSNFAYRTLTFINKYQEGKVGSLKHDPVIDEALQTVETIKKHYEEQNFKEAVKEINALAHIANSFFQKNEPWKLEKGEQLDSVLTTALNFSKNLAIVLKPILPVFSENLLGQLNLPKELSWNDINFETQNHEVGDAAHLAEKLEQQEEKKEEFVLNIKVGKITHAAKHPESDKLVVLQVDVDEPRQIVAGIQQFYAEDELVGRNICVITNLKKAKLGGIHSDGMLLAAGDDAVLVAPKGNPGDQIYPGAKDKYDIKTGRIEYKKFQKVKLVVDKKGVLANGERLKTDAGDVEADVEDGVVVS